MIKKILCIFIIISLFTFINVCAKGQIDTDSLEQSLQKGEYYSFCGSIEEIIQAILNNELSLKGKNVLENILEILFISIKNSLPSFAGMMGLAIILSFVDKLDILSSKIESTAKLGGRILFCLMLINSAVTFINLAKNSLNTVSSFTQALSPVLITFLASCGAQGSINNLAPSTVLLSSTLVEIAVKIVFPLILMGCSVSCVNSVLPGEKLKGITDLFKNISSWIIGIVFTVFAGVVAIQGVISGFSDGISIRSIKYALSSSVPVIGGSISESFSMVLLSGYTLKSAAGIMGMIIIAGIIIIPVLNIFAYIILLNFFCAFVQPFSDPFIIKQTKSIIEFLKLIFIVLIGVSVLWFIFLGIIVSIGSNLI
jgi:stage III sporulation protein AE